MTSQCLQQTDAFRDLYRIFANREDRILEFEILPPAFGPILEDDCSVGITKKYLVQAFVSARRVFFDGLKLSEFSHRHGTSKISKQNAGADENLSIASQIILLFDCEHLTACNWRKRRLSALINSDKDVRIHALNTELSLTTTYLCSPLHRHTKSPTLWQHRQWIQTQLIRIHNPDYQAAQVLLQAELSAVLRAGELHPRNYYAFTYMRQIHSILSDIGLDRGQTDWSTRLGKSIITSTLDWCLAHPADISGFMFLLYLLNSVPDTTLRLDIVGKVASFALDIGWIGEGIWTFVDLAVRQFSLIDLLGKSRVYPWDILLDPVFVDTLQHSDKKPRLAMSWRIWLDRAQVHWAQTR
ncbi:hypothetical protein BJX99DRAFT_46104 [Aspergillus californicus]